MKHSLKISKHGQKDFDEKYFEAYYKKYSVNELIKAYRWFKGWIRLMDQIYPLKNGQRRKVLEIGCGIGAFSKILKERGFIIKATDISSFIISKAKKLQKGISFSIDNIEKSKEKGEYDLIFALEVLEHLDNPDKALEKIKSILKRDSLLVFSSPYPTKRTLENPTHINVRAPEQWIKLGQKLGFQQMKFQYVSFLPFFYRYSSFLSRAIPIKSDLPIIVNTCFFYFRK